MKITLEVNTRQPNIELFEHYTVGQAHGAKKLRFREFEEANVGAIENDAGGIDIAPAYALFDGVFQHGCRSQVSSLRSQVRVMVSDTRHSIPGTRYPRPRLTLKTSLQLR